MSIKIRNFKTEKIKLFNSNNEFIGDLDENQIMDVQCQIAESKLEGYYYEWGEKRGTISPKGELSDWFSGMFDLQQILFAKLYKIRKGEYDDSLEERINKRVLCSE